MKQQHSQKQTHHKAIFQPINYKLMILGGGVFILGVILMIGGKSEDPNVFNKEEIYSFSRITLAPILMILAFVIEVVAVMYRKK